MRNEQLQHRRRIAERLALPMFVLSLLFLVCQAVLVVIWVDVPNFSENAALAVSRGGEEAARLRQLLEAEQGNHLLGSLTLGLMLLVWPAVIAETVMHWWTRPWNAEMRKYHFFGFLYCVCPSLRMCARSPEMRERLWLPGLGWRVANKRLRKRLEIQFGMPMIVIALMILPVLIIEFFMKTQVAQYAWLRFMLHVSTGVIWFAFAAEFILMLSVAEKKIAYCKAHWVDLAIIVLPIFSFLRSLRVLRATQAAKALKISQITKLARAYRLRGTALKGLRALMLLEFIQRMITSDIDRSIEKLERQLEDLDDQAKEIKRKIARLEKRRQEEQDTNADRLNEPT